VQKVLLVGGSTRIPLVRRMLAAHGGQEPQTDIHPDEAVALGAAVQAAIIAGKPIAPVLVDVAPRSLGILAARLVLGHVVTDRYSVLIPEASGGSASVPDSRQRRCAAGLDSGPAAA
jgi:molecular chaperone DnaK